ncbi:hypothetical protein HMPREF9120_00609 [Neisseria sp. oral taxon 020 str. F0370]|nr:hypothetical protein HMPREF9120_00609 [Neisseria sp. oral taxon 020 str. F0370]
MFLCGFGSRLFVVGYCPAVLEWLRADRIFALNLRLKKASACLNIRSSIPSRIFSDGLIQEYGCLVSL